MSRAICIIARRLLFVLCAASLSLYSSYCVGSEANRWGIELMLWMNPRRFETTTWKAKVASTRTKTPSYGENRHSLSSACFFRLVYFSFINCQSIRISPNDFSNELNRHDIVLIEQFYWRMRKDRECNSRHTLFALSYLHRSGANKHHISVFVLKFSKI